MKEASRKLNKDNFNKKQVENLIKTTSLNLILQSNHIVKETGSTAMINLQGVGVLTCLTINSIYTRINQTKLKIYLPHITTVLNKEIKDKRNETKHNSKHI